MTGLLQTTAEGVYLDFLRKTKTIKQKTSG